MSQQALADKVNMKQSHIARLESGEVRPSIKMLKRYAGGLEQVILFNIAPEEEFINNCHSI
jgi:transcriptional regulator with XRE-family HTH domain